MRVRELTQIKRTRNQGKAIVHATKIERISKDTCNDGTIQDNRPSFNCFDVSKHTRFMSALVEKEVAEKVTTNLEWPKDKWMLLLQSMLEGKAREVSLFCHEHEQSSQSCKESCCDGL